MQTRWRGGCLEESSRRKGCVFRCVCVWRVGASLYCGSWCRGLGVVKKWGSPPPLPAEPHSCGLVCLRLLVNTAQLNTSSWCARPHCTAALRGAFRNRGHELRNKPRTVWCWKKFLKHCICVQDHSNLSSHHLWMRLIEIRHQTKSAVKPAVNNKKTKHASPKQQQDQVSWCWVTLKTYLPIPVLAPASLACLHGCRVQEAVIRCRICEAAQRSAASLFLETALQSSAIILHRWGSERVGIWWKFDKRNWGAWSKTLFSLLLFQTAVCSHGAADAWFCFLRWRL